MENADRQILYDLIRKECSGEPVRELLRKYKRQDADIRVSDSVDKIYSYLENAHAKGIIPDGELIALLSTAEENGRQHIAFFVPESSVKEEVSAVASDFEYVSKSLLGNKTPEEAGLPNFTIVPQGTIVADLRREITSGTDYSSWTYKVYEGQIKSEFVEREERDDGKYAMIYRAKPIRGTLVIKWHSFGLLEFRIDKDLVSGRKSYRESIENCWTLLANALNRQMFEPLDLEQACIGFINAAEETDSVAIGNPLAEDADGNRHKVHQVDPDANFMRSSSAKDWRAMMSNYSQLSVRWFFEHKGTKFPKSLHFSMRLYASNDIFIGSQASEDAVSFIVHRIFDFSTGRQSRNIVQLIDEQSPSLFSGFVDKYPHLSPAIEVIEKWIKLHPGATYLEPASLFRIFKKDKNLTPDVLAETIGVMAAEGLVEMKYRVRSHASGGLLPPVYQRLSDLPATIEDEYRGKHTLDDVDVVPVYELLA